MSVLGSIFSAMEFKKIYVVSNIAFILFRKGCSKMSLCLLSLLVGRDEPATMGLNLRPISIYLDFCVSTTFFICLDM